MRSARRLAWVTVAVGSVAAAAALFAPDGRWYGVDLGAAGAGAFALCVLLSIWLFAARSDQIFPDDMSIVERRAWVGLVFLGMFLASLAREMVMLSGASDVPEHIRDLFTHRFIERYIVLAIAWGVVAHLIGRRDGGIEADERDLRLRHRADRAGDWAFTLLVLGGIVVLASVPGELLSWWLAPIVLANVLIGLLIAKSLVEHVVLAISYRSSVA
jgi:hypothetical protein